jgi:hypothetical protein
MRGARLWLATGSTLIALAVLASPATLRAELHATGHLNDAATQSTAFLLLAAAFAAWAAGAWLIALCVLSIGERRPGTAGRVAATLRLTITPRFVTSALRIGITTTAGLGIIGQLTPASAAAATSSVDVRADLCGNVDALPRLDRISEPCAPITTDANQPPATASSEPIRIVRPGDTLWAIAVEDLTTTTGRTPEPQAIAETWPRWWQANRDVIGSDPALLHPGAVLHAPTTPLAEEREQ